MGVLVELWVGPDDKNSSVNIIQVSSLNWSILSVSGKREKENPDVGRFVGGYGLIYFGFGI